MRYFKLAFFALFSAIFLYYLSLPSPEFPVAPSDSAQSVEPADSETPERRAYFTNYTREEVLSHYQNNFILTAFGFTIPSYRLIYPPEEAYPIIRDQTRSTHLVEIVYPFRESIFVNEFVATSAKDDIWYKGINYDSKITVNTKNSSLESRLMVGFLAMVMVYLLSNVVVSTTVKLFKSFSNIKYIFIK